MVIFFLSFLLIVLVVLLMVCCKKFLYNKLPKILKSLLEKLRNMLMYNSGIRFILTVYQLKFLDAVLILSQPEKSTLSIVFALCILIPLILFVIAQMIFLVVKR